MEKELLYLKRKKAKELYNKSWSIRRIANYLHSCKNNVRRWINLNEEEILKDNRGWKKGLPRKYTIKEKEEVIKIRSELEKENSYFFGSLVVKNNYENKTKKSISIDFINRTLREAKMVKSPSKKKKGLSKYMKYPIRTLNKLGKSMMSMDFIGPKYLKGSSDRINFLSCKYIRPEKHGLVIRVKGQTANETIRVLKGIWKKNPIPDVVKVDNDIAFGANMSETNYLGKIALFFLNLGITPLYVALRSPWNNGENEGFNSVFSKKFWNRLQFTDEDEIDVKIEGFNIAYKKYSNLISNNPKNEPVKYITDFDGVNLENNSVKNFKAHKIYFLRVVRRKNEKKSENEYGAIKILGEEIRMPIELINLFVFCTLDLKLKKLIISSELDDGTLKEIKSIRFIIENIKYE